MILYSVFKLLLMSDIICKVQLLLVIQNDSYLWHQGLFQLVTDLVQQRFVFNINISECFKKPMLQCPTKRTLKGSILMQTRY